MNPTINDTIRRLEAELAVLRTFLQGLEDADRYRAILEHIAEHGVSTPKLCVRVTMSESEMQKGRRLEMLIEEAENDMAVMAT